MLKNIFLIFIYLFAYSIFGQNNQPPVISSEGNSIYCPQTQQNIVISFNIEDTDDDTLDALYIQISEGYSPGEDQLIYNGSNPDINTSWNVTDGKLEISSLSAEDLPISDIIDAVYEVVFFSSNPNPSDKSFHSQLAMLTSYHQLVTIMFILNKQVSLGYKLNRQPKTLIIMDYKDT